MLSAPGPQKSWCAGTLLLNKAPKAACSKRSCHRQGSTLGTGTTPAAWSDTPFLLITSQVRRSPSPDCGNQRGLCIPEKSVRRLITALWVSARPLGHTPELWFTSLYQGLELLNLVKATQLDISVLAGLHQCCCSGRGRWGCSKHGAVFGKDAPAGKMGSATAAQSFGRRTGVCAPKGIGAPEGYHRPMHKGQTSQSMSWLTPSLPAVSIA